jgi:hypothetical protein
MKRGFGRLLPLALLLAAFVAATVAAQEAPAELTPTPIDPTPAPAEPTPAPAESSPTPPEPTPAAADASPTPPEATPESEPPPKPPNYYRRTLQLAEQVAVENDRLLWGRVVERVPASGLGIELDYFNRRFDGSYDGQGHSAELLQPIKLHDPFGGHGQFLEFDPEARCRIRTFNMRLSYGVTDDVQLYADLPVVHQEGWLIYQFYPGTSVNLGVRTLADAFRLFRQFGRPDPIGRFHDPGWNFGDTSAGVVWTYLDTPHVMLATQFNVTAPTGLTANPNQAQRFGLGVQIDEGQGAVAPGVTEDLRLRVPEADWIAFRVQAGVDYYLPQRRRAPTWEKPNSQAESLKRLIGLQGDDRFIDAWGAPSHYLLTLGAELNTMAAVTFQFPYFSAGVGYLYNYRQTPMVDVDWRWERFFKASDSYLMGDAHALALQVGAPLLPLRLPGLINLGYEIPLTGRNSIVFDDRFQAQLMFVLPVR